MLSVALLQGPKSTLAADPEKQFWSFTRVLIEIEVSPESIT